jgi:E3 ubiquitin-protein ligase RNF115/126
MPGNPFAILQRMMDPANAAHGDAVFSQEALDRVITQLMEQNQGSTAPGPASEAAIRSLPKRKVDKEMLDDQGKAECSICMDSVELGEQVTVLPCKHWFHDACITAWLNEHDTCPHCRKGISQQPEANGSASYGSRSGSGGGAPSRPPRRASSGSMPGGWRETTRSPRSGTSQNPVIIEDGTSPGPADVRAARQRYYSSHQGQSEDLERRDTSGAGGRRRSSRSTPSLPNARDARRYRSESYRSNSNGGSSGGGGFAGWVRSLGGGGGGDR